MTKKTGRKAAFGEKGMRLVRSWETMILLADTSDPLTAIEINGRINSNYFDDQRCSDQTTRSDLQTLRKCGFPICEIDKDGNEIIEDGSPTIGTKKNNRWCLRDPSKIGEFTPFLKQPTASDIVSLSLCRALLQDQIPSQYPLRSSVSRMLEELQLRLNKRLRLGDTVDIDLIDKVRHLGKQYVGKSVSDEDWTRITTAIARKQVMISKYKNRDGEMSEVDIAPLAVWFSEGRAYVLAAGATDKKIRAWRMDRFSESWINEKRKAPDIDSDEIEKALRTSFKGYISAPVKVRLKVKPEAAYLFREFEYHSTQKIDEQLDGSLDVTMECAMGWGLEEWILGFGELVVVEGPEALRERLGKRSKEIYKMYR